MSADENLTTRLAAEPRHDARDLPDDKRVERKLGFLEEQGCAAVKQ